MRELGMHEIEAVAAGQIIESTVSGANTAGVFGTIIGAAATGSSIGATRGGIIGVALGGSFGFGWGVGTVIYNYFGSGY